jgi:hypothetical protein
MTVLSPGAGSVADGGRVSLVEQVVRWFVARRAARVKRPAPVRRGPGVVARFFAALVDALGTLVGCGAITVAGFLAGQIVGFLVLGVAVFVLDFKVSTAARARAARRVER